jgi:tetraacyldisaccharide 4'-kinase
MTGKKRSFIKSILDAINPYAWVTDIRNQAFNIGILPIYRPEIPTICIGNIAVGGTGKTPHTEYLAKLLKDRFRIAVLSRGYGRKSKGYILSGASTTMEEIGDEPFQIKNKFHDIDVAVCEKRPVGIRNLLQEKRRPEVILLDDAFQHRYVEAGLNILLIDSNRPTWLDCVLPFGRLREKASNMNRADIIIITKCKSADTRFKEWCRKWTGTKSKAPVFFSRMRYGSIYNIFDTQIKARDICNGTDILLVTGIAKPAPMKVELESRGARVMIMKYADHHNFSHSDIADIVSRYKLIDNTNKMIVTTEKDATRLIQRTDIPEELKKDIYALPIEVEFLDNGEELFNQIIGNYVTENSGNS